jgi:hypothetical protein
MLFREIIPVKIQGICKTNEFSVDNMWNSVFQTREVTWRLLGEKDLFRKEKKKIT